MEILQNLRRDTNMNYIKNRIFILIIGALILSTCNIDDKDQINSEIVPELHRQIFNKIINSGQMSYLVKNNDKICFKQNPFFMIDKNNLITVKNIVIKGANDKNDIPCCGITEVLWNTKDIEISVSCSKNYYGTGGKFTFTRNVKEDGEYELDNVEFFEH